MKFISRKIIFSKALLTLAISYVYTQERNVKADFESGSFYNNPKIPFDEPFVIMGEAGRDYGFKIITYRLLTKAQKGELLINV
jgi:hypothetical protein